MGKGGVGGKRYSGISVGVGTFDEGEGASWAAKEGFEFDGWMMGEAADGAVRLLTVDCLVRGGGGQSGTGVGGLLASFEDEGGVSFVMVYFGCPRGLTGVDGSWLHLMLEQVYGARGERPTYSKAPSVRLRCAEKSPI